jgi:hypothetical protein
MRPIGHRRLALPGGRLRARGALCDAAGLRSAGVPLCRDGPGPLAPCDREAYNRGVTIKERLHKLVDELSDGEADEALRYIAERRSAPVVAAFRDAPVDDEPVTSADEQAIAEVQADRDAGVGRISFAEIKRLHGQA